MYRITHKVLSAPIAVHMEVVVPVSTLSVDGTVLRAEKLTSSTVKKPLASLGRRGGADGGSGSASSADQHRDYEEGRPFAATAPATGDQAGSAAAPSAGIAPALNSTSFANDAGAGAGAGAGDPGHTDSDDVVDGWTVVEHGHAPNTVVCRPQVGDAEEVDLAAAKAERSNLERRVLGPAGLIGEDADASIFPAMPDAVMDTVRTVYECFACDPAASYGAKKNAVSGFEGTEYDHITEAEMKDIPHFDHVKVTLFSKKARQGMVPTNPPAGGASRVAGGGGVNDDFGSSVQPGARDGGNSSESSIAGSQGSVLLPSSSPPSSSSSPFPSFSSSSSGPSAKPLSKGLVLHFHGGGFVSSTTKTHEVYLRKWAVELDCPVVSIDYSLSPQHPYPRALNECFFVYSWALANAERFGWSGERICFTGDSAGGNLAVAVALRCIRDGIRGPDGIVIAYPVLCVASQMSPSRLISLMDPVLPYGVLIGCLNAYMPAAKYRDHSQLPTVEEFERDAAPGDVSGGAGRDGSGVGVGGGGGGAGPSGTNRGITGDVDPLLSPLGADSSLLRRLPPISIAGVLLDPLLDDAVAFAKRLKRLGNQVKLEVFEELCHGFLNFSAVHGASAEAAGVCSKWIKEAIDADVL